MLTWVRIGIDAVPDVPDPTARTGQEEDLLPQGLDGRGAGHVADRPGAVGCGKGGFGQRPLLEGVLGQDADGEIGHRFLGDDGVDRKGERGPGLAAQGFDPFVNHVPVTSDADVLFGLVVSDGGLDLDLAPGHVQAALLVDHVDRQQGAFLIQ